VDELDTRGSAWRQLDEELQIMRWRTERLLALGYRLREAAFLALAEVDIHELERLIESGCPLETAVRIAA
jgi:hypothetical protein